MCSLFLNIAWCALHLGSLHACRSSASCFAPFSSTVPCTRGYPDPQLSPRHSLVSLFSGALPHLVHTGPSLWLPPLSLFFICHNVCAFLLHIQARPLRLSPGIPMITCPQGIRNALCCDTLKQHKMSLLNKCCPGPFPTPGCRLPLWNTLEGEQIEAPTSFCGDNT